MNSISYSVAVTALSFGQNSFMYDVFQTRYQDEWGGGGLELLLHRIYTKYGFFVQPDF
jgi:hypothetical protein